jgi:paraquat-inducible protein A
MDAEELIACRECDALYCKRPLRTRSEARCTRCGATLYQLASGDINRPLAVVLTALVVFAIANAFPIVHMEAGGITTESTLAGGILQLWAEDMQLVAVLVFCTTVLFPFLELCALAYVLLPLRMGFEPRGFSGMLRMITAIRPWSMTEVFMLGTLVALVKLSGTAAIVPGPAIFAFGVLTLLLTLITGYYDQRNLWDVAEQLPARRSLRPGTR